MQVFHHTFRAMGTRFDLVLPGIDAGTGQELSAAVSSLVVHLERRLSRFDPDSVLSGLNARAAAAPVALDDDLWEILSRCAGFYRLTGGTFDITCLPLFSLWRTRGPAEAFTPPSEEAVAAARARTGMHQVELDPEARTVRFLHPDLQLDLGAYGKGYALERVGACLDRYGIGCAFVSFGESSILARGVHPSGQAWPVGIEHLFRQGVSVVTFDVADGSVSTSGTTPNNRPLGAARYGHVIDPRTGIPVEGLRTMSVVSDSPVVAEVLSTALLVAAPAERSAMLEAFPDVQAVEAAYPTEDEFHLCWAHDAARSPI